MCPPPSSRRGRMNLKCGLSCIASYTGRIAPPRVEGGVHKPASAHGIWVPRTRVSKHNLDAVPSQAVMDDLSSRHTNIVGRVHRRSGSSLQTPGLGPIKGTVDDPTALDGLQHFFLSPQLIFWTAATPLSYCRYNTPNTDGGKRTVNLLDVWSILQKVVPVARNPKDLGRFQRERGERCWFGAQRVWGLLPPALQLVLQSCGRLGVVWLQRLTLEAYLRSSTSAVTFPRPLFKRRLERTLLRCLATAPRGAGRP